MLFAYHQHVPLTAALSRNDEILPRFIITSLPHGAIGFIVAAIVAAALSPSLNAMAATTVNDFYLKYVRPDADQATLMRLSRQATYGWGIVQLAVALGAQWMRQSVLDAGLSVLSLTTGPVLGAFMVGVLTRHVGSRAMLGGMAAGRRHDGGDLVHRRPRVDVVGAGRCRDHERGGPAARALPRIPNCAGRSGGGRVNTPDILRSRRTMGRCAVVRRKPVPPARHPAVRAARSQRGYVDDRGKSRGGGERGPDERGQRPCSVLTRRLTSKPLLAAISTACRYASSGITGVRDRIQRYVRDGSPITAKLYSGPSPRIQ